MAKAFDRVAMAYAIRRAEVEFARAEFERQREILLATWKVELSIASGLNAERVEGQPWVTVRSDGAYARSRQGAKSGGYTVALDVFGGQLEFRTAVWFTMGSRSAKALGLVPACRALREALRTPGDLPAEQLREGKVPATVYLYVCAIPAAAPDFTDDRFLAAIKALPEFYKKADQWVAEQYLNQKVSAD